MKLLVISFFILILSEINAYSQNKILNVYSELNDSTHVIITTNFRPTYNIKSKNKEKKLSVEILNTNFIPTINNIKKTGIINKIKCVKSEQNLDIIFDNSVEFTVQNTKLENLTTNLWQISFDLKAKNNKAIYYKNLIKTGFLNQLEKNKKNNSKIFTVVLDPGHGGIDSGAIAKDGTLEKNITLAFCKVLKKRLEQYKNIQVFLTREADRYLYLDERIAKARNYGVDLFISIHADIINSAKIRGSTVYTLSKISSDKMSKSLENSQNQVDEIQGEEKNSLSPVDDILINLTNNETKKYRNIIVQQLIKNIKKQNILMINNPSRSANFKVLKALDFPSVLIELGYLSNKQDKKTICMPNWQIKMANAIANAVKNFINLRISE